MACRLNKKNLAVIFCRLNHHTGYGYYTNPIHIIRMNIRGIIFVFFFFSLSLFLSSLASFIVCQRNYPIVYLYHWHPINAADRPPFRRSFRFVPASSFPPRPWPASPSLTLLPTTASPPPFCPQPSFRGAATPPCRARRGLCL